MNRPRANAIDHGKHGEERLVIHVHNGGIGEYPVLVLPGQIVKVTGLPPRNPNLPKLLGSKGENCFGNDAVFAAAEADEARVDGGAGFERELLVQDAAG